MLYAVALGVADAHGRVRHRADRLHRCVDRRRAEVRVLDALGPQRAPMVLTLAFAAIAVALAVIGVYRVLTWAVAARRGDRRAWRSARAVPTCCAMVMKQGARIIAAGLVPGVLGSVACSLRRFPRSLQPICSCSPARCWRNQSRLWLRAGFRLAGRRVDPLQALREN